MLAAVEATRGAVEAMRGAMETKRVAVEVISGVEVAREAIEV